MSALNQHVYDNDFSLEMTLEDFESTDDSDDEIQM